MRIQRILDQVPSPCYVLDESLLIRNLEKLKYIKDNAGVEIILALKGFSMYSMFPLVRKYLDGATASSLNEARLAHEEMEVHPHVYAPIYLEQEFDEIMRMAGHITFNTLNQWERYKHKVEQFNDAASNPLLRLSIPMMGMSAPKRRISCGIRINPQYSEVSTDMYNPCVPGSRLGVTADVLGPGLPEGIEGLHFHTLCENDSYTLERTLAHVEERFANHLIQAKWVNMGGGHLITREGYDPEHAVRILTAFRKKWNVEVILEPGSAIGWQTGWLVSTVQDVFDSQGIPVAMLDTSFAAHMPDTLEMPYKPRILGATDAVEGKPTYRLGGGTCLAGDYMGDYSFDHPLRYGDKIVFDDMIHYTMVKTTTFNGVNLPSIGIIREDGRFELIRHFGYESFRDRLG